MLLKAVGETNENSACSMKRAILLTLLLLIAGCAPEVTPAPPAPANPAPAGMPLSNLTVFYPSDIVGANPMVTINGADTCRIATNTAFHLDISPGNITITSSRFGWSGTSSLSFTAIAGQTYYVKYSISQGELWSATFGSFLGEAIQQATTKHPGPFDIELSSEAAMGKLKPSICTQ